ncbi:hypothetical protein XELAEV_18032524mg [Xenopus laevis]|uniref:Secreted protein n=1 Tax=Xenopus laevis TaxID=8355 RepID=A0A974CPL3_XENLA|nr:hypothetical protein XELAEV_18032524mg [Xenopus laevis]
MWVFQACGCMCVPGMWVCVCQACGCACVRHVGVCVPGMWVFQACGCACTRNMGARHRKSRRNVSLYKILCSGSSHNEIYQSVRARGSSADGMQGILLFPIQDPGTQWPSPTTPEAVQSPPITRCSQEALQQLCHKERLVSIGHHGKWHLRIPELSAQ